jgi:hypothetical protein
VRLGTAPCTHTLVPLSTCPLLLLPPLARQVAHMEVLVANRAKAADTDKHVKDATAW